MSADVTREVLKLAREKIAQGWTQGPLAVSDSGKPVHPFYRGTSRCARGSLLAGAATFAVVGAGVAYTTRRGIEQQERMEQEESPLSDPGTGPNR